MSSIPWELLYRGRLNDHDELVSVLGEVDVMISALPYPRVFDQLKITEAIKEAGNIKRFVPSDFGVEEDRVSGVLPPFGAFLEKKMKIRRAIEAAKIPYTFVSANCLGAYFVNLLLRHHEQNEEITVYGSGEAKAVLNYEEDVGIFTIKVATDPRTCNHIVTCRPTVNVVSQLELISMWKKIGKTFNKVHLPEEELMDLSESLPPPHNIPVSILHNIFVKGATTNFDLCGLLETSALHPELKLTTVDELLEIFLHNPPKPASTPVV